MWSLCDLLALLGFYSFAWLFCIYFICLEQVKKSREFAYLAKVCTTRREYITSVNSWQSTANKYWLLKSLSNIVVFFFKFWRNLFDAMMLRNILVANSELYFHCMEIIKLEYLWNKLLDYTWFQFSKQSFLRCWGRLKEQFSIIILFMLFTICKVNNTGWSKGTKKALLSFRKLRNENKK